MLYLIQSSSINNFRPPFHILCFIIALFIWWDQFRVGRIKLLCLEISEQGTGGMAIDHHTKLVFFPFNKVLQGSLTKQILIMLTLLKTTQPTQNTV